MFFFNFDTLILHVGVFSMFFGRTHLRMGVSKATFDEESDFEVRFARKFSKPRNLYAKYKFCSKRLPTKNFWCPKMKCWESSETLLGKF